MSFTHSLKRNACTNWFKRSLYVWFSVVGEPRVLDHLSFHLFVWGGVLDYSRFMWCNSVFESADYNLLESFVFTCYEGIKSQMFWNQLQLVETSIFIPCDLLATTPVYFILAYVFAGAFLKPCLVNFMQSWLIFQSIFQNLPNASPALASLWPISSYIYMAFVWHIKQVSSLTRFIHGLKPASDL